MTVGHARPTVYLMKSVGAAGDEIKFAAAQKYGATVAVVTAPIRGYGSVAIHFPKGASMAERHEQARALPCFELHVTERNEDGSCTSRGMVVCS